MSQSVLHPARSAMKTNWTESRFLGWYQIFLPPIERHQWPDEIDAAFGWASENARRLADMSPVAVLAQYGPISSIALGTTLNVWHCSGPLLQLPGSITEHVLADVQKRMRY